MIIKNWKKEIFTVPNLLSLFRLLLIPVYVTIYLNATEPSQYLIAGLILAVSCLTDMIDGKIARHFNAITMVGKVLDPIADKLTQFTLTICLSLKHPVLRPVLCLFFVKEIFQLVSTIVNYRRGKALAGALLSGKICTTVLFISLIIMVLLPGMDEDIVAVFALVDAVFLLIAFVQYIFAFFGKYTKLQDITQE